MILIDTDILIWAQRGNEKAAKFLDAVDEKIISLQSYLELLQGAKNLAQQKATRAYISSSNFRILPLNESIGHRALVYIEEYSLAHGLQAGDALIAASAVENNLILATGNAKHFRFIRELELKQFRP